MLTRRIIQCAAKAVLCLLTLPVVAAVVVCALLYMPSVQRYATQKACSAASEALDMRVSIGDVRLDFPLNLRLNSVLAEDKTSGDTLLCAKSLTLRLGLLPLFWGEADVEGARLEEVRLDTKALIAGTHVRGNVGELDACVRSVAWETGRVTVRKATLRDANVAVCLCDTALDDTVTTKQAWMVEVMQARLERVNARVSLPAAVPDTAAADSLHPTQMWIAADLQKAALRNGFFHTGQPFYGFEGLKIEHGNVAYRAKARDGLWTRRNQPLPLPADRQPSPLNRLRCLWDYADNMLALQTWQPFSSQPRAASSDIAQNLNRLSALDPDNITLYNASLRLCDLSYNERGTLRADLRNLSLRERCGLQISDASGKLYMDSERLRIPAFRLRTGSSDISIGIDFPFDALERNTKDISLNLNATIGYADVKNLARGYVPADLLRLYPARPLTLKGSVRGNMNHIVLSPLTLSMPGILSLTASGRVNAPTLPERLTADMQITAATGPDLPTTFRQYMPDVVMTALPRQTANLSGRVRGSLNNVQLIGTNLQAPGLLAASVDGTIKNLLHGTLEGDVRYALTTAPGLPLVFRQALPDVAQAVSLPASMQSQGSVRFTPSDYLFDASLQAGGTAYAKGHINLPAQTYDVALRTAAFPVKSFVPSLDCSPFTGTMALRGNSFTLLDNTGLHLTADADIQQFAFAGYDLSAIKLTSQINGKDLTADFEAHNINIMGDGTLIARLEDPVTGRLEANFSNINLLGLGLTTDTLSAGGQLDIAFHATHDLKSFGAEGLIGNIFFQEPDRGFTTQDLAFGFQTQADSTFGHAQSGDLLLRFGAKGNLDRLLPRIESLADSAMAQIGRRELDQNALRHELPPLTLHLEAGQNNPFSSSLRFMGYSFRSAYIDLAAHPRTGISGTARAGAINTGSLLLDTVDLTLSQDTTGLQFDGMVRNFTKRNPTKFDARLHGYLLSKGAGLEAQIFDTDGEKGIDLGLRADLAENGIRVRLYPENPVLAYRAFSINHDNYIFLGKDRRIEADLDLLADDGTGLKIYSTPQDSVNDITVSVNHINLGELSNVVPYLPKMSGLLSGDFHVFDDHKQISAMGSIEAQDFQYEDTNIGTIGADVVYLPNDEGEHHAQAFINHSGQDVLEAEGTYFQARDGEFEGTAKLHDFPLAVVSAMLEGSGLGLKGIAGGDVSIKGKLDKPVINGQLNLDSAFVFSNVYGFNLAMDEKPIAFENSRIRFDQYALQSVDAANTNPLLLNGTIDMSRLDRISLDLKMQAQDFQLINAQKTRQSMVFGKAFANYTGSVSGTLSNLSVRGKLDILDRTDMTYILKDSPLSIDNRLDDLVKFTSFTDSIDDDEEFIPIEEGMKLDIVLGINISDAARFHCYLSEDGKNYANIDGGGNLTLRLTQQGDMRLTGKITAQGGDIKYELPVIPLRTFKLVEGSTIDFTGDPANPTLNIKAKERMKVLVTEDDQQRNVAFDVGVAITKPLSQMGLEFTIEAPEDLSIQNHLASMSDEQRAKTAVAMMATGMYITDSGAQTSGFKANNALNAFLQNEIQNIAGKALKSIDISVGVETGTSLTGTQTTDYSFQFSKRFWEDRIRVVIGGRVSAGKNADNRAESIINNISVEYRMNKGATRYVRLFYDRDTQDPLEGQITKTGVGYSVRRKATRFGDLFLFKPRKKKETQTAEQPSDSPTPPDSLQTP